MSTPVRYILDACALLAYFQKESGSEKIAALIEDENVELVIHPVNLGEVYYITLRHVGPQIAD